MHALHHVGAAAPGPVTPTTSDEAPAVAAAQGFKGKESGGGQDCARADAARKLAATLAARAALLGLALHELHDGACLLVGESGRRCELPSLQAAESLVYGCEHVRAEVAALAGRLVSSKGVRA